MISKNMGTAAIVIGAAVLLTGCGGGGGGNASSDPNSDRRSNGEDQRSDWPIAPETAQMRTGAQAPDFSVADVVPTVNGIADSSNVLLHNRHNLVGPSIREQLISPRCFGAVCDVSALGVTITFEIGDEDRLQFEVQPTGTHRNVSLSQLRAPDTLLDETINYQIYGGWLDHSAFGITVINGVTGELANVVDSYGFSLGDEAGTNPTGVGSATWSGVMVGRDISRSDFRGNFIQGDADITIENLERPDLNIAFTNIVDLNSGFPRMDMTWNDISLRSGRFRTGGGINQIEGYFYGPGHVEVGGVFERGSIHGAFGAARD